MSPHERGTDSCPDLGTGPALLELSRPNLVLSGPRGGRNGDAGEAFSSLRDPDWVWSLVAGGEMGARIRSFDWSATPLGPLAEWPPSLRQAVSICLRSRFQLAIYWGPQLVLLYNDAEREVLGAMHPGALGRPAAEFLADNWDVLGPMLKGVL